MTTEEAKTGSAAAWAVRAAGLWVLAGAVFKTFNGSPALLPEIVRDLSPFGADLTFKLTIGVESCIGTLALVRPRLGWWIVALTYVLFDAILVSLMAAGEAECGCFGKDFPIPVPGMLAIDSVLLLGVLITRPWRLRAGGAPLWLLALALVGIAAPWVHDRQVKPPGTNGTDPVDPGAENGGEENGDGGYTVLDLEKYVGQSIYDTELAKWIGDDVYTLPGEGLWVLYRWTCTHCKAHLEEMANQPPAYPFIVLVRLNEAIDNDANRQVVTKPAGPNVLEVSCPDSVEYVCQTPAELVVEGGIVVSAAEGVGDE